MKSKLLALQALKTGLLTLVICLVFLPGCLGTVEKESFVFIGKEPVRGAAQIVDTRKIKLATLVKEGNQEKTVYTEQECGQFVVLPPHVYQQLLANQK